MALKRALRPHYGVRLKQGKTVILTRQHRDNGYLNAMAMLCGRGMKPLADQVRQGDSYVPLGRNLDPLEAAAVVQALNVVDGYGLPPDDQAVNALAWWFDQRPYTVRARWWYAATDVLSSLQHPSPGDPLGEMPTAQDDWVETVCAYVRDVLAHDQAEAFD